MERFARHGNVPVLIEGESGTGKTMIARRLHERSPRQHGPYHNVVLSTLEDSLASSELFGHVTGAFTDARRSRAGHFVSASGGTLFLDEIGKATLSVQQKLLHAIEYGEVRPVGSDRDVHVDVRVVAATNVPLHELVGRGTFLPDLYMRIFAFRIVLPPLRNRKADVPGLVRQYVAKHALTCAYSISGPEVHQDLMDALVAAEWPGNLRQLDATVHRLLVEADGAPVLTLAQCTDDLAYLREIKGDVPLTSKLIANAIGEAGSVSRAAKLLGVHRTTLYRYRRRRLSDNGDVIPHGNRESGR